MWQFTDLDVALITILLLTVGFAIGVMWWEYWRDIRPRRKDDEDDRGSDNVPDLSVHHSTGSVLGPVGDGANRDSNPSTGRKDNLGDRRADSDIAVGENGPTWVRVR